MTATRARSPKSADPARSTSEAASTSPANCTEAPKTASTSTRSDLAPKTVSHAKAAQTSRATTTEIAPVTCPVPHATLIT